MHPNRLPVMATLSTLRQCGFFEEYSALSDEQAVDALLARLRQVGADNPWYQAHPEYRPDQRLLTSFRNPGEAASVYKELAAWDFSRVWTADLEADVCAGNQVYADVVDSYARLSLGTLQPTNISEQWASQEGPVTLSFVSRGRLYSTSLAYYDDWIDEEIFSFLDRAMQDAGFPAAIYGETNTGQEVFFVRATPAEKARMEQQLGWSFDWSQYLPDAAE